MLLSLSVGTSIFTVNCHFKGHGSHRPPDWIRRLVLNYIARLVFMEVKPMRSLRNCFRKQRTTQVKKSKEAARTCEEMSEASTSEISQNSLSFQGNFKQTVNIWKLRSRSPNSRNHGTLCPVGGKCRRTCWNIYHFIMPPHNCV